MTETPRKPDFFRSVRPLPAASGSPLPDRPASGPAKPPPPPSAPIKQRTDDEIAADERAGWTAILPWPPAAVVAWRQAEPHRRSPTEFGRLYLSQCAAALRDKPRELSGSLAVELVLCPSTNAGRSVKLMHNYIPVVHWALTQCGVWLDQAQVRGETHILGGPKGAGAVYVSIWRLDGH